MEYTTRHAIPKPADLDPVRDGAATARAAADRLDLLVPEAGTVLVNITAANTDTDATVTFASPYPAPPAVVATPLAGTNLHTWTIQSVTTTGFTIRAKRASGTAAVSYMWVAVPE